jgi:T5SS/PEP-CTERM-associated repeat protein
MPRCALLRKARSANRTAREPRESRSDACKEKISSAAAQGFGQRCVSRRVARVSSGQQWPVIELQIFVTGRLGSPIDWLAHAGPPFTSHPEGLPAMRHRNLILASAVLSTVIASRGLAAIRTWDGGGGASNFYDVNTNWSGDVTPLATDSIDFSLPGTTTVVWDGITGNTVSATLDINAGLVNWQSFAGTGPFTHTVSGQVVVNNGSTFRLSNHTLTTQGFFDLLNGGTLEVNTTGIVNAFNMSVGFSSGGTLNVLNGGRVNVSQSPILGEQNGVVGTVSVANANSSFTAGKNLILGTAGTTGKGNFTTSDNARVGIGSGGAALAFAGGLTIWDSDLTGNTGGNLIINNGSVFNHNAGATVQLAGQSNSYGKMVVSGANSAFNTASVLAAGLLGNGTLDVNSGGKASVGLLDVGAFAGSTGVVTIGSGSTVSSLVEVRLGFSGGTNASVTVNAGGRLNIGDSSTAGSSLGMVIADGDLAGGDGGLLLIKGGNLLTHSSGNTAYIATDNNFGLVQVTGTNSRWINNNGSGISVGLGANAKGFLEVLAGGRVEAPNVTVGGFNGTGTVSVDGTNSVLSVSGLMNLSSPAGPGTGLVTASNGGTILVGDAAFSIPSADVIVTDADPVGTAGGVLSVRNGSKLTSSQNAFVGLFAGQAGRVIVSGAGSEWTGALTFGVGNGGAPASYGELIVENGGRIASQIMAGSGTSSLITVASGGRIETTNQFSLSEVNGSNTSATVTGTNSTIAAGTTLEVGFAGTGTLNIQSAGKVTAPNATVGRNATGVGTINLNGSGSLLDVEGDLTVGALGQGVVNLNGGNAVLVGDAAAGAIDLRIADSNLAGNAGGNVVLNNNSSWTMNDVVRIAAPANTYGRLAVNGGSTFSTNSAIVVGDLGSGVLDVTAGGRVTINVAGNSSFLVLGFNAPTGRGTVTVDGAGSLLDVNNSVRVGNLAGGAVSTLTVRNGGLLNVGDLAEPPMSPNGFSVHVSDANLDGLTGGVIDISPGSLLDASNDVAIAGALNSFGRINVNGTNARLKTATNLVIGGNGLGRLDATNGGRAEAAALFIFNGAMNVSGTGSTVEAANLSVGPTAFFSTPGTLNLSGGQVTVTTGSVQVAATGTLNLSGGTLVTPTFNRIAGSVVNFTGGTLVNHTFTGQLTQNGGINSPGNVGVRDVMTITGGYTQTSGTLAADLFASNNDVIASNGPVVLGGALSLNNVSFPTTLGTSRVLIDAPSVTGHFSTVSGFVLSPTRYVAVTYGPNSAFVTVALPGDATLSNGVGFPDLVILAQNYNLTGRTWVTADFDGNGATGFSDLVLLAQNYGLSSIDLPDGASPDFASDWALAQSMVPEPTMLLALPALLAMSRGRRR